MIDQIRASKLPSNMMQFAARGALQVPPAENIEILVYLARYNKVFGEVARMTLAGWDEKASLAAAGDPATAPEVLNYFISPDNVRPKLLPALLENPSVREAQIVKLAGSALRDTIDIMLKSPRVRSLRAALETLRSSPYLRQEESAELQKLLDAIPVAGTAQADVGSHDKAQDPAAAAGAVEKSEVPADAQPSEIAASESEEYSDATFGAEDETVFYYLQEHSVEIAAEGEKPFQAIGGMMDLLMPDSHAAETAEAPQPQAPAAATKPRVPAVPKAAEDPTKRVNTVQKINALDVKGRIQLALKGNKEERSILIRDGTKVVALAVLEAPKLSDGEVEKFASQKNVLEAVLRQIPLKRRFMKNYIVVRNLVANPRTPLDLGLGLMKNLLTADLKNLSANKEVSETIRKLALKMYKQKLETANKK
ncbi:MAG TPA: hypothetical protein VKQ11_18730 [Candidatus Sulfotelmatobacter sp.]|nr:hypothetical protein [Candidatus Sulfotelmatobacter sp.]